MSTIDTGPRKAWAPSTLDFRYGVGPRPGLTCRQEAVMATIEDAHLDGRAMPTLAELAREFGVGAASGMECHLRALRAKGWLEWEPHRPRSLRPSPAALERLGLARRRPAAEPSPPPAHPGLGPSRAAVLGLVVAAHRERRPAPTYREIAAAMGWSSPNAAREHLVALLGLGLVERAAGKSRATRPTAKALGQQP